MGFRMPGAPPGGMGALGAFGGPAGYLGGMPRRAMWTSAHDNLGPSIGFNTQAFERSPAELAGYNDPFRPSDFPDYPAHTGDHLLPSRGFGNWTNSISTTDVWGAKPGTQIGEEETTHYITNDIMSQDTPITRWLCPLTNHPEGPEVTFKYKEFPISLPNLVPNGGIDKAVGYKEGSRSITMTRIGIRCESNLDELFMGKLKDLWLKFKQVSASVKQEFEVRAVTALLGSQKARYELEKAAGQSRSPIEIRKLLEKSRDNCGGMHKRPGFLDFAIQDIADMYRLNHQTPPSVALGWSKAWVANSRVLSKHMGLFSQAGSGTISAEPLVGGAHTVKTYRGLTIIEPPLITAGHTSVPYDMLTSPHYIGDYAYSAPSADIQSESYSSSSRDVKIYDLDNDCKATITLKKALEHCGRFGEDGSLHPAHERLAERIREVTDDDAADVFLYRPVVDGGAGRLGPVRCFGDLEASNLPDALFNKMVETAMRVLYGVPTKTKSEGTTPAFFTDMILSFLTKFAGVVNAPVHSDVANAMQQLRGACAAVREARGEDVAELVTECELGMLAFMRTFGDVPEEGVDDAVDVFIRMFLRALPITRQSIERLIDLNIVIPFTFYFPRPFQRLVTGHIILTEPGGRVCRLFFANPSTTAEFDAIERVSKYHYSISCAAGVLDPTAITVIRNAGFVSSGGGCGAEFFSYCKQEESKFGPHEPEEASLAYEREVSSCAGSMFSFLSSGVEGFEKQIPLLWDMTGSSDQIGGYTTSRYAGALYNTFYFGLPVCSNLAIHDPTLTPFLTTTHGQLNTMCWRGCMETASGAIFFQNSGERGVMNAYTKRRCDGEFLQNDMEDTLDMFKGPSLTQKPW
jgi:hypothetical protein